LIAPIATNFAKFEEQVLAKRRNRQNEKASRYRVTEKVHKQKVE
jgi:hypothetical protein